MEVDLHTGRKGSVKNRKAAVSVRIGAADVRNLKAIAKRLGVRDSDVFRYAVKNSLEQLGPLVDPGVHGRHLLPVFVEAGPRLLRFFELDAARLAEIVNAGVVDPETLVAPEDLTLLSMTGVQQSYALVKLSELLDQTSDMPPEKDGLVNVLREYLYEKYVFRSPRRAAAG
jgi:hypothetical protein